MNAVFISPQFPDTYWNWRDDAGTQTVLVATIRPTFIKIRMTQGALVDAKAYVMCTLTELNEGV